MNPEWKMEIGPDRRRAPRFQCFNYRECPIDFEEAPGGGRLSDLSREGLSLQSSRPLQVNQTYHLKIVDLKSGKRIPCEIHVMWVRVDENNQCTCGARIVQMDAADKMDFLDVLYEDWKREVLAY